MGRALRLDVAGMPQHVVQRGIGRQAVFFEDDDYRSYLWALDDAARRLECRVHAYVLMTNHVHLLLTPGVDGGVGRLMQSVGRRYVQRVNRRLGRTGTLWEGRYHSSTIESDRYLLACYRYIEMNPVRAMMVERPSDYPWSSHGGHVGLNRDTLIDDHPVFLAMGPTPLARQAAYRRLCAERLPADLLRSIRHRLQHHCPLGSPDFIAGLEKRLQRSFAPTPRGRPPRHPENRV